MARYERMKSLVSSPPAHPLEQVWVAWVAMQRELVEGASRLVRWARAALHAAAMSRSRVVLRMHLVAACVRWVRWRRVVRRKKNKRKQRRKVKSARAAATSRFDIKKTQALLVNQGAVTEVNLVSETQPFGFSPPTPWDEIVTDFLEQTQAKPWSGAVNPQAVLHEMFYVMNSNLGTDRTVLELISKGVSLEEMQAGRVWVQCKTPWESIEKMSMTVVRMKGSGMRPSFHLGPPGIMRIPFTVWSKGVWSTPVWVNVGALPFSSMYEEELENFLLSPPARKLTSLLRLSHGVPPPHMMKQLAPLLAPLCKTGETPTHEAELLRAWHFRAFSDAIFITRWRWDAWWRGWRSATGLPFSHQLGVLRFITSTKPGARFLVEGLLRCRVELADLFQGRRYISIRGTANVGELRFSTGRDTIPRATHETTLGGAGPCCVPLRLGPTTYVWVNVLAGRHVPRSGRWSAGVYMYLFKHAMRLLRGVKGWVKARATKKLAPLIKHT